MDCYDLDVDASPETSTFVTTNPPWGVRLTEDIETSWDGLKHFIRNKCPGGTRVYVLSGDKSATGILQLKRDRMIPIQTGEQHLRWVQYSIRGRETNEQRSRSLMPDKQDFEESLQKKPVDLNGWG
jgi:23S rRNA G2445 N2-methylase RlmL